MGFQIHTSSFGNIVFKLILWFLFSPLVSIFAILFSFRIFLNLLTKFVRANLIPINNPIDNLFCVAPSKIKQHVYLGIILMLKQRLDVGDVRNHFQNVFLSTKQKQKRCINFYCYFVQWCFFIWKKTLNVLDLEDRIKERTVNFQSYNEMEEYLGEYIDLPDCGEHPAWEILLIHSSLKLTSERDDAHEHFNKNSSTLLDVPPTVLVLKLHHSLFDGYSVAHILDQLCGQEASYQVKDCTFGLSEKLNAFFSMPHSFFKLALETRKIRLMPWPEIKDRPADKLFLSLTELDLDKLKKVRRILNCHLSTILGFIHAQALRRHFNSREFSGGDFPDCIRLTHPVAVPNHPVVSGGELQNHFSLIAFTAESKPSNLLSSLSKTEEEFCNANEGIKLPYLLQSFVLPLLWGVPQTMLQSMVGVMRNLGIPTHIESFYSPNLFSNTEYELLGVPVLSIYPHCGEMSSFMEVSRIRMMSCTVGKKHYIAMGGRKDSFASKSEVDFIAKTLMPNVLDEILEEIKT